jgi:hypothetical protein
VGAASRGGGDTVRFLEGGALALLTLYLTRFCVSSCPRVRRFAGIAAGAGVGAGVGVKLSKGVIKTPGSSLDRLSLRATLIVGAGSREIGVSRTVGDVGP